MLINRHKNGSSSEYKRLTAISCLQADYNFSAWASGALLTSEPQNSSERTFQIEPLSCWTYQLEILSEEFYRKESQSRRTLQ